MLDALYDSTHKIIKHSYKKIQEGSYINFKVYRRENALKEIKLCLKIEKVEDYGIVPVQLNLNVKIKIDF